MAPPRIAIVNVQVAVDLDKAAAGNPHAAVVVSSKGFKKSVQYKKGGAGVKKEKEAEIPAQEQEEENSLSEVQVKQEKPEEDAPPKTSTPNSTAVSLDEVTSSIEFPSSDNNSTDTTIEPESPKPRVLRSTKDKHLLSGIKFGKGQRAI